MFGRVGDIGSLTEALAILTSMITPALLISACGTLIVSTSSRLGRVVDRIRKLSDRMEELAMADDAIVLLEERRRFIVDQLDILTHRAHVLQRAMALLYVLFVKVVPIISIWELKAGDHQPPTLPPAGAEERRLREQHS